MRTRRTTADRLEALARDLEKVPAGADWRRLQQARRQATRLRVRALQLRAKAAPRPVYDLPF